MPQLKNSAKFRRDTLRATAGLVAHAERILNTIHVENPEHTHSVACLLFAGVVDGCRAAVCLLNSGLYESLPKVLRPMIDMSVDLINVGIDHKYCEYIVLDSVKNEKANLDYAMKCEFVAEDKESVKGIEEKRKGLKVYEENLASSEYKKFENYERFKRAEMLVAYNIIHRKYSGTIHGSLFSLEISYGSGTPGKLADINKKIDDRSVVEYVEVVSLCLSRSVASVTRLCAYNAKNRLEKFNRLAVASRLLLDSIQSSGKPIE